ncbi:MAG: sensor histidine kinase N-terminal domain-containing protein [Rhodanobacteraceae bacterium]|nr:sensor histidine kinase N-terminal domain-containing protein [Rhodanobacteraceae bacterium]MBL0040486.1 sensor histidine kinase N-terminal domain-containing protein [Xanthomonadales bacterium]MBP6079144.1 sensor histidine kinase N-terminal domain-containing protein [Xanthomonadales bacterium]MBP7623876.1 sensor histidine kinase N-terminal domain-containing protein [Xanthomonadales bacterium]
MTTRPRSLQARVLVLVLGMVALVWVGTAALTWFDTRHELEELLDSHLAQAAAVLIAQQYDAEDEHHVDAPQLHRYAATVMFQVFHNGRLVLHSADAPRRPLVDHQERNLGGFREVRIDDVRWRVFTTLGKKDDVIVHVGERLASRNAILWAVLRSTLWPMVLALPLLGLAAWWAVRRGVEPLRQLGRTLALREPQVLAPVSLDDANAEVAPLVDALNGLLGRIASLMSVERRFTADAAHELRTPIAAIRAQAQVALAERDDGLRRHALEATIAGCDRAARLIGQLLMLSRLDASMPTALTALDLSALARSVVGDLAPKAVARSQVLSFDADEAAVIAGDETLLSVLIRNLVDNAIRYSPNATRIAVKVKREGSRVELRIDDGGPGLEVGDRQRLGERFFRVGGGDESGSGLGWSIVRRIADVHGLSVDTTQPSPFGGLSVRVAGARIASGQPQTR